MLPRGALQIGLSRPPKRGCFRRRHLSVPITKARVLGQFKVRNDDRVPPYSDLNQWLCQQ